MSCERKRKNDEQKLILDKRLKLVVNASEEILKSSFQSTISCNKERSSFVCDTEFNLFTLAQLCDDDQLSSLVGNALFLAKCPTTSKNHFIASFLFGELKRNTNMFAKDGDFGWEENTRRFLTLLPVLQECEMECTTMISFLKTCPPHPSVIVLTQDSSINRIVNIFHLDKETHLTPLIPTLVDLLKDVESTREAQVFFDRLVEANLDFFRKNIVTYINDGRSSFPEVGDFFTFLEDATIEKFFSSNIRAKDGNIIVGHIPLSIENNKLKDFADRCYPTLLKVMNKYDADQDEYVSLAKFVSTKNIKVNKTLIFLLEKNFLSIVKKERIIKLDEATAMREIIDVHVYQHHRFETLIPFMYQFDEEACTDFFPKLCKEYEKLEESFHFDQRNEISIVKFKAQVKEIVNLLMMRKFRNNPEMDQLYISRLKKIKESSTFTFDVFTFIIEIGFPYEHNDDCFHFEDKFNQLLKIVSQVATLKREHLRRFWEMCEDDKDLFKTAWQGNQSFERLVANKPQGFVDRKSLCDMFPDLLIYNEE